MHSGKSERGLGMRLREDTDRTIKEIVENIKVRYRPEKIILFGSYAYGHPKEYSDIDLFIIKATDKRRIDRFVEVSRLIYEPNYQISVCPLVYTPEELEERLRLGDVFVKEILSRGKVLYERQGQGR